MHSGIGPSGAVNTNWIVTKLSKGCFEMILNRISVTLTLPADKKCAVVSNDQLEPVRHRNLLIRLTRIYRALQTIEVALQNHLGRNLIHVAARVFSFLTRIAQGSVGCDRG